MKTHSFYGREVNVSLTECRKEKDVGDRDEDDPNDLLAKDSRTALHVVDSQSKRVQVADDIVRHTMETHSRRLRYQVIG